MAQPWDFADLVRGQTAAVNAAKKGSVNPYSLVPIAVGGVVGGALGDTEQERTDRATLGGLAAGGAYRYGANALPVIKSIPAAIANAARPVMGVVSKAGPVASLGAGLYNAYDALSNGVDYADAAGDANIPPEYADENPLTTSLQIGLNKMSFGLPGVVSRTIYGDLSGRQAEKGAVRATAADTAPQKVSQQGLPAPYAVTPNAPYPGLGTSVPAPVTPTTAPSRFPLSSGPTARVSAPSTIGSAQQTATAPAAPPAQQYPTFAESPELKAARQKASESAGRIDSLFEKISEANKTPVPQGLSATDKWSLLAGALGTAAMVSAFPEYGVLAGIGAGLSVGSGGYNAIQARNVNAAEAERQRKLDTVKQYGALYKDQYQRNRDEVTDMRNFERGAFADEVNAFEYAGNKAMDERKFNEEVRQFGMSYALQNKELAQRAEASRQGQMRPDWQALDSSNGVSFYDVNSGRMMTPPPGSRLVNRGTPAAPKVLSYDDFTKGVTAAEERLASAPEYKGKPNALRAAAQNQVINEAGRLGFDVSGFAQAPPAPDKRDSIPIEQLLGLKK